jgi:membrane protease YdiL (CAAX protease family)
MNVRLLILESILLYFVPPLLVVTGLLPKVAIMPLLWIVFFYSITVIHRSGANVLRFHIDRTVLQVVLARFFVLGALMTLFVILFCPQLLFSMPKEHTGLWLMILFLYPPLSALVQEIVFRAFFAYRFETILKGRTVFLLSNGILFAYIHSVFGNAIAVVFSFIGAFLFMSTYLKTRSVAMSAIEHALYGNLIFTLGIGNFFYHNG